MDPDAVHDIADAFFDALIARDYDRVRALCAPAARTWSNGSGVEQTMAQLLAFLPTLRAGIRAHWYDDVRRLVSPDGFCQQHHVTAETLDGTKVDLGEACSVVRLDEQGMITRFDEYIDTLWAAQVVPLVHPEPGSLSDRPGAQATDRP